MVLASRCFAIKSHPLNKQISSDIVLMKIKPNPENDDYFFDDEPKDWYELGVYPNKLSLGKAQEIKYKSDLLEDQLLEDFKDEDLNRKIDFIYKAPAHSSIVTLVEKNNDLSKYYINVSEIKNQPGFIQNLRAFLNITGITTFP